MNGMPSAVDRTPMQAGLMFGLLAAATYLLLEGLYWWQMPSSGSNVGGDGPNPTLMIAGWLLGKPAEIYWQLNPEHRWRFNLEHGYRASIHVAIVVSAVFWGLLVGWLGALRRRRNAAQGIAPQPFVRVAIKTVVLAVVAFFASMLLSIPLILLASAFK